MAYDREWKDIMNELASDSEKGLSQSEADKRIIQYGKNEKKPHFNHIQPA